MKKLFQFIARLNNQFSLTLLRWSGYSIPSISKKKQQKWLPGYVRYFNILWYPKEGWINIFHNCSSNEEINQMLLDVYVGESWGPPVVKKQKQAVIKAKKREERLVN